VEQEGRRRQVNAGIGCSRISGIWSERLVARADMESAHGEPHVAGDRAPIKAVIGFGPCWSDRCCHDGGVSLRKPRKRGLVL
jgi:hypothetical protein